MKTEQVKEKLSELGIVTNNIYPKKSYIYSNEVHIGLYGRELAEDFYFFSERNNTIFKVRNIKDNPYDYDYDSGTGKFQVPITLWEKVWEDTPYVEQPDAPFKEMTLRDYAAIHLRVPQSNHDWLNTMIKETSNL